MHAENLIMLESMQQLAMYSKMYACPLLENIMVNSEWYTILFLAVLTWKKNVISTINVSACKHVIGMCMNTKFSAFA